jgi:hypothetical protein
MTFPPISILLDLERTASPRRVYDNRPYVTTMSVADRLHALTRHPGRRHAQFSTRLLQRRPSACDQLTA